MSDDDIPFGEKAKTIGVNLGGHKDRVVTETTDESGEHLKHTTEGDPLVGTVTHVEHADSDRVDAIVRPVTFHVQSPIQVPDVPEG